MIVIYKAVHGLEDLKWDDIFDLAQGELRGHHLKFVKKKCHHNIRLNSFGARSINLWNSFSEETVTAASLNIFKSHLNNAKMLT